MSLTRLTPQAAFAPEALTVFVRGLTIQAAIGVNDNEQGRTQPLVIDVRLDLTPRRVERLSDTCNYEAVARFAGALAAEGHIGLVETFAQRLAEALMGDDQVRRVQVSIAKPEALDSAEAAGCEVSFAR